MTILTSTNKVCESLGISLCLSMPIHRTRGSVDSNESAKKSIEQLNKHLKEKLNEEFDVRFHQKNIDLMKCLKAFDAGDKDYLSIEILEKFLDILPVLDVNKSVLRIEVKRAKEDHKLGIPFNSHRVENLLKLFVIKNSLPTSTASVERAFSGMNRICTKLRSTLTPERLSDLLCLSLNQDIVKKIDIDQLIDRWAAKKHRRILV